MFRTLLLPIIIKLLRSAGTTKARMKAMTFIPKLLFAVGTLFALIALHIYLAQQYGYVNANLLFAGLFIVLGLLIEGYLIARIEHEKQLRKESNLTENLIRETSNLTGFDANTVTDSVKKVMRKHGGKVILGTVIAGLLLGRYGRNPWDKTE